MKLKGPVFPSYLDQVGPRPSRNQWKAHCGKSASMRNLRHKAHKFLTSKDAVIVALVHRVEDAVREEPMPEFGKLHLICAAMDVSDQTGETWATCMKYFMDKYDAAARGEDPNADVSVPDSAEA